MSKMLAVVHSQRKAKKSPPPITYFVHQGRLSGSLNEFIEGIISLISLVSPDPLTDYR